MYSDIRFNNSVIQGDSTSTIDNLFSKSISCTITEGTSSLSRKTKLCITVERPQASHTIRKDLIIRLTDECDPFFIYNLCLTEEDFQHLKSQQGLLIDFPAFPQKFIDLLELCLTDENKENPKFVVKLASSTRLGAESVNVQLDIIEMNPFKYLTHLSLKLCPAPDSYIKKYLANCLKMLKDEKEKLESCLRSTRNDLQSRLDQTQENLLFRNEELERVKQQLQGEICGLGRRHSDDLRSEQEKLSRIHREGELKWDKDKKELEAKTRHEIQQLQSKVEHLEFKNRDLQERLLKSDASTRELRGRYVASEDDLQQIRHKNQTLAKENQSLDKQFSEQLKSLGALKLRLTALEQQLKEKEHDLSITQGQLRASNDLVRVLETTSDQKQATLSKRESAIRMLSEELNKGNEIIMKLQNELKTNHTKLKLRSQITTKQEEAIEKKDLEMKQLKEELPSLQLLIKEKESKMSALTEEVETLKKSLEESRKHVKSNENVINWLNKQLNDVQAGIVSTRLNIPSTTTTDFSVPYRIPLTSTPSVGFQGIKEVLKPLGNRLPNSYQHGIVNTQSWGQTPVTTNPRIVEYRNQQLNKNPMYFQPQQQQTLENVEPGPKTPPIQTGSNAAIVNQRRNSETIKSTQKPTATKFNSRVSLGRKTQPPKQ